MRRLPAIMLLAATSCVSGAAPRGAERPNIVYLLADDLGYGDLSCANKESKLSTANIDRLAAQGRIFTDAHSGSAVCTPTRYGILTGRYCWRTRLQQGVLDGLSPPLIPPGRPTVASFLRGQGYRTACIGKWHLGLEWTKSGGAVDYAQPIRNGPTALGFDTYFGISASLDMPPYIWIDNDRTVGLPTATKTWIRAGPAHPDFEAIEVLPTITRKATEYIDRQANGKDPFFLYLPLNAPHTPILPSKGFQGKSGIGPYGDFVLEVDWTVGQVLAALERNGLADRTLVVLTSDNGCSPSADFPALARHGHNPNYVFRGAKADIFEGGHHIPFIVRWPGRVAPGTRCDDTVCLTDLMATCAEILGAPIPEGAGEDSVSLLPDLLGTATGPLREATVHHSINGSFSIRQGRWKLEFCPDSGGWSAPRPGKDDVSKLPPLQLYDLSQDIAERTNVQAEHPDEVERLTALMRSYIERGRSTPGKPEANDRPVAFQKPR